jgi:hypothetical protein
MESETRGESALETRIRLLRELERSVADKPDVPAAFLAAIRELLMEAEAEAESGQAD